MITACSTNCGYRRDQNEDYIQVLEEENVLLVADGVGGANSGEVASRLCVTGVERYLEKYPLSKNRSLPMIKAYFGDCLTKVNHLVHEKALSNEEYRGMATTLVGMILGNGGKVFAVNIGDSRLYLLREGNLFQITEDHTYVNDMLKRGLITPEDAVTHENRYIITRAIGAEATVEPDFYEVETQPGDLFLLCTDGLYEEVKEETLQNILEGTLTLQEKVGRLVGEALEYGGLDNISLILAEITEEDCI